MDFEFRNKLVLMKMELMQAKLKIIMLKAEDAGYTWSHIPEQDREDILKMKKEIDEQLTFIDNQLKFMAEVG